MHQRADATGRGKVDEAAGAFQKALATDPSSFIALQELNRTGQMVQTNRIRNRKP